MKYFSLGVCHLQKKDTFLEQGSYVSIWKTDVNGNWKYVLDTGNEGLEKK